MPITPTPKIWMNGNLVDWADAKVHVLTHTLHYGTGTFEGIRAYNGRVFMLDAHIDRLYRSAQAITLQIPIGKAEMIREGTGPACIISYGHVFANVMKAVDLLAADGIDVAVVNARFVKPLDLEMVRTVASLYPVLLSVEEGCIMGGFGSAVNEALVAMGIGVQCDILGVPDAYIEHGDQAWQADVAGISPARIAARVREAIAAKAPSATVAPAIQPHVVKTA